MQHPSDELLKSILASTKVIAVVGISNNPARPSYGVSQYLAQKGYRIIPVNPGQAGSEILGERVYARLSDIPESIPVDMVDIFRRSEAVPEITDEALAHLKHLRSIWMQIGVEHEAAALHAEGQGIKVVQNLCPKMEFQRLYPGAQLKDIATSGRIESP